MNHCAIHREAVVCPKPRRVGWQLSQPTENSDSKAGSELLDIIFAKGGPAGFDRFGTNNSTQLGSSPPFFCGSPPSRVSNPLIQDARFLEDELLPSPLSSSEGHVRTKFGNKPVVRVEGFDCLDRERSRNCSIPSLA